MLTGVFQKSVILWEEMLALSLFAYFLVLSLPVLTECFSTTVRGGVETGKRTWILRGAFLPTRDR